MIEQKYAVDVRVGIQQGTRKLIEATINNLKSMAGLLSSMVFDRLSIETAKLKVSDNAIKTGALNEIKTQITDWKMRQQKDKGGIIIPYEKLSMEALEGLIEEFVTPDNFVLNWTSFRLFTTIS